MASITSDSTAGTARQTLAGLNLANLQTVAAVAVAHNMKLYIDAIPADGGQAFQSYPSAWQADWNTATENGTNFNWDSTRGAALAADVHAYYNNIVTTLEANQAIGPSAVGIVSIGNEINETFVGVPSGSSLYYELVYKGAAGVKSADSSVAVMLHLHDVGASQWTHANQLANAHSLYGTPQIDFNVFGFSFHSFDNPLTNPNWEGSDCASSNGETIGLVQAFQSENFGQFTNETTNQPDSGTPIYLMVAETEWAWTGTAETVNGTSYPLTYTSTSQFVQDDSEFTYYQLDASGYRQYLEDEMNDVSGMRDGLGKGVNDWGAAVITGWGSSHGEYNFAFWGQCNRRSENVERRDRDDQRISSQLLNVRSTGAAELIDPVAMPPLNLVSEAAHCQNLSVREHFFSCNAELIAINLIWGGISDERSKKNC